MSTPGTVGTVGRRGPELPLTSPPSPPAQEGCWWEGGAGRPILGGLGALLL